MQLLRAVMDWIWADTVDVVRALVVGGATLGLGLAMVVTMEVLGAVLAVGVGNLAPNGLFGIPVLYTRVLAALLVQNAVLPMLAATVAAGGAFAYLAAVGIRGDARVGEAE